MKLLEVLLPVVRAIHARRTIGSVETDTLGAVETPSTDIELTSTFVRENDSTGAEDVRLNVHGAPCLVEVVCEGQIQLVRSR